MTAPEPDPDEDDDARPPADSAAALRDALEGAEDRDLDEGERRGELGEAATSP